jgi:hypothetical protein|tara:strand:- start:224 stop:538 length:315 start_codon:yes stop_codon:yes gene_type:complete
MKKESRTYNIKGQASINTSITSQAEVLSDIRSIKGVTTVGFTPKTINPAGVLDNRNYKGSFNIKIDNFPFEKFDKEIALKNIVDQIRKIPAVNFFRVELETLLQ